MLRVLDEAPAIREAQKIFLKEMQAGASHREVSIGYRGGGDTVTSYALQNEVWFAGATAPNRYWNGFFRTDPSEGGVPAPVVEVNPPLEGINRKCVGVFLADEKGRLYLGHRGRLGGGKKGIGKGFFEWYPDSMKRTVEDGDRETDIILIGRLDSGAFVDLVTRFVRLAEAYKADERPPKKDVESIEGDYYLAEFSGVAEYDVVEGRKKADFIHGRIVAALHRELKKKGFVVANSKSRDLYIMNGAKQARVLFEVKSSGDTQSVYTAVGQLMWNSDDGCTRVLVLPSNIDKGCRTRAEELSLELVTWSGGKNFAFDGLDQVVAIANQS